MEIFINCGENLVVVIVDSSLFIILKYEVEYIKNVFS